MKSESSALHISARTSAGIWWTHDEGGAGAREDHPQEQRHAAPDHVLPVLRAQHQPGIGHGRHEVEKEQAHVSPEDHRAEKRQQEPDGAVAPRCKDECGKPRTARHRKGEGQDAHGGRRRERERKRHHAPGGQPEHDQDEGDERLVPRAEHRPLVAAGRDEQPQEQKEAQQHAAAKGLPVDDAGRGPEQRLQLDLLLMRHHVAGPDDHFPGLHAVEHRFHGREHILVALAGLLLVHGQRGHDHQGHDLLEHALGTLIQPLGVMQLADERDPEHAQVRKALGLAAEHLGAAVQVAHDGGVVGAGKLAHVGDDAVGKGCLDPGYERVQQVLLHIGSRQHAEGTQRHLRSVPLIERPAHGLQARVLHAQAVDALEQVEAFLAECRDAFLIQVEDHGLTGQGPVAALLGGPLILHHHVAVGNDVHRRYLPRRIEDP